MEKGQLFIIVCVALVVAVIVSILTASITGNAIIVSKYAGYSVTYSQAEIDAKFANITTNQGITYQGVLNMLGKCNAIRSSSGEETCNQICGNNNRPRAQLEYIWAY